MTSLSAEAPIRSRFPIKVMASATASAVAPTLLGRHPSMDQVRVHIQKIAPTDATVLLTGESGTGKDIVARLIHLQSKRAAGPFVAINCGAIPNDLLESELFGHERGAFTGAVAARAGLFPLANRGTILLDEVHAMSPALQVKLLRVLQEHEIQPVGSGRCVKIDIRVVAASNTNLEQEVAAGRFRQDLYYRLNVIPVALPPLRERRSDIPLLVAHFLDVHNRRHRIQRVEISDDAMTRLSQYTWPGNVRELENLIERMVILADTNVIQASDLPIGARSFILRKDIPWGHLDERGFDLPAAVERFESALIDRALSRTLGNRQAAARLLGMKRTTLVARLARRTDVAAPSSDVPKYTIAAPAEDPRASSTGSCAKPGRWRTRHPIASRIRRDGWAAQRRGT